MKRFLLLTVFFICASLNAQLYPVPVYSVTSKQTPQGGEEASYTIDGKSDTMYHSQWYKTGIPDELNFTLYSNAQSIKQIVYTPRQSGLNGVWTKVDVSYSKKKQPDVFIAIANGLVWQADNTDKIINLDNAITDVAVVRFAVSAGYGDFSSCAEMKFLSNDAFNAGSGVDCTVPAASLPVDTKVSVLSATATSTRANCSTCGIEKTFDGDVTTVYKSANSGTVLPVDLVYNFNGSTPIAYLRYTPRQDGSNGGLFDSVNISYNTTGNSTYQNLMTFDFNGTYDPMTVKFPNRITPLSIKLTVVSAEVGYATCAEMEFYTGIDVNPQYTNIFVDDMYSALKPGVTQTQINAMSSDFYKGIAQCLFNGTYNSAYRTQKYTVYKPIDHVTQELKVGGADKFENPTGLFFKTGERVVLFVRNLPADKLVPLNLLVQGFDNGWTNAHYPLQNGMNVIDITSDGLGYINYFNSDLTLPDVEINIVNGTVNGYFDVKKSDPQQWPTLLQSKVYPRVDVVGEYAHMIYNRDVLKMGCPNNVTDLISKYDEIIKYERLMMGFFKYNKTAKYHQMAFSDYNSTGWYAYGDGINLDPNGSEHAVTDPQQLSFWGIAHEFGHNNQLVSWIGTTEVTNNIYSAWVQYNMENGGKYTRLEANEAAPTSDMPSVVGGDINGTIDFTQVQNQPLQQNSDVFRILVPFWQLELYYQKGGACRNAPELSFDYPGNYTGVDYARWFGTVAEATRNTDMSGFTNGEVMLSFVKNTCDAVQEDLTDFFKNTGFLKPISKDIDDYGVGHLEVTQDQIDQVIAYVKGKNYQKPVSPVMNYISAFSVDIFKNKLPLSGTAGVGVALNGTSMVIDNSKWPGAVAFETFDTANKLMHVAIFGTDDISLKNTTVYYPSNASAVFAVGYDGKRIQVYPAVLDTTAPVINAPANVTVNTDVAKSTASNVALGVPTATDNSGVQPTITNNAPATYPLGVTSVVWTAKDSAGNTATATQTVTVKDAEVPVISAPANVVVNTDAGKSTASNVALSVATATDNSGVQPTLTNNAPATYPIGVTNVVWTAKDSAGNTTTATQTVTVKDAEVPVINVPANVVVNTDAGKSTAANVALGVATATDNSGVPTITNNAPATYPIGVTNVIWTAKDNAGNTTTATQTVTVKDVEAPVISAPADQTFSFNANGNYQVPVAIATDNVNIQSINYTISGATQRNGASADASGQFNVGTSTINWTATDVYGNTSTAVTSVLVKGPATLVLNTIGDSFVRSGTYGNDNYGTQPMLTMKQEGANFTREVYLKFDLSTLPASFEKATLRLNIATSGITASKTTWSVSYVSNDNWTETGITWNNKPAASTVLQTISGQSSGWVEWNITDQVLSEVGQDKILTLKITGTSYDSNSQAAFSSKECSDPALKPQLYVNVYSQSAKMAVQNDVNAQLSETTEVTKMVLYPNPTADYSHMTSSVPMEQIRILNANGQQLFIASGLSTSEYDINVENLPQGFYFIQINGNGWQKTERLIKK